MIITGRRQNSINNGPTELGKKAIERRNLRLCPLLGDETSAPRNLLGCAQSRSGQNPIRRNVRS